MASTTIRQGFIFLKTSRIHKPYRKYFFVLKVNRQTSRVQLDYFQNNDLASSRKKKTIYLEAVQSVERRHAHRPHAFHIHMPGRHCMFACTSETDADSWVGAIKEATRDGGSSKPSSETFAVTVHQSPVPQKAKVEGSYLMEITSYDLVLWEKCKQQQQTLQEVLRCPISSIVEFSHQRPDGQQNGHLVNLKLASDMYQGLFIVYCVEGPKLLQAISTNRSQLSEDLCPEVAPRRSHSVDFLALHDDNHDENGERDSGFRRQLLSYSCENILAEAGMSTQSGPPVPPRAASSDDLYALPRSFSCGVLATRLRNLDPSNIYYGDDTQFKTEDEEDRSEHSGCSFPPPVPPPNFKASSLPGSPNISSPASPAFAPLSAPLDPPVPSPFSHIPAEHEQASTQFEKKKEAKLPVQTPKVSCPRVLVKLTHDGRIPETTTGPPTMPRPVQTLPPNEQARAT